MFSLHVHIAAASDRTCDCLNPSHWNTARQSQRKSSLTQSLCTSQSLIGGAVPYSVDGGFVWCWDLIREMVNCLPVMVNCLPVVETTDWRGRIERNIVRLR